MGNGRKYQVDDKDQARHQRWNETRKAEWQKTYKDSWTGSKCAAKKTGNQYSNQELQAIASGGRLMPGFAKVPVINFNGKHFRIGGRNLR